MANPMLQISIIKAGIDFFNRSPTFTCMHIAPSINNETTTAEGKTKKGIHNPKRSRRAELILMNPIR
jgi:hypothetical protein